MDKINIYDKEDMYECYFEQTADGEDYVSVVKNGQPLSYVIPTDDGKRFIGLAAKADDNPDAAKKMKKILKKYCQ